MIPGNGWLAKLPSGISPTPPGFFEAFLLKPSLPSYRVFNKSLQGVT